MDRVAAVATLWGVHREALFPATFRNTDVSGLDMVMLDADVAGCVSTWLDNGGALDERRWTILRTRKRHLEGVVPELSGDEAGYCRRLLDMAMLILDS